MEEATLQELRQSLGKSQEAIARKMESSQTLVSRVENLANIRLESLMRYVDAIGGTLGLTVKLHDGRSVRIKHLYEDYNWAGRP